MINAPVERISVNRHAGIPDSSTHLETVPFAEKKIAPSTKSNSPRYLVNTMKSLSALITTWIGTL